jgi:hypothetical protein
MATFFVLGLDDEVSFKFLVIGGFPIMVIEIELGMEPKSPEISLPWKLLP